MSDVFPTGNAIGGGVRVRLGRPGLGEHLAFSHGVSFLKVKRGDKQVNKYSTTSLYT
uniref:Uncharacterized protein n=1 Tax=viral metagenome TaxID=1070528 RepID=A0A6C0DE14_9ZZZZ